MGPQLGESSNLEPYWEGQKTFSVSQGASPKVPFDIKQVQFCWGYGDPKGIETTPKGSWGTKPISKRNPPFGGGSGSRPCQHKLVKLFCRGTYDSRKPTIFVIYNKRPRTQNSERGARGGRGGSTKGKEKKGVIQLFCSSGLVLTLSRKGVGLARRKVARLSQAMRLR